MEKQDDLLEFVPTNLHIQQMCVSEGDGKGKNNVLSTFPGYLCERVLCIHSCTYILLFCMHPERVSLYVPGGRWGLFNSHIDIILSSYADQLAYNVVTVGAPTAYNLKYRNGGLIKWQTTAPYCYAK